MTTMRTFDCPLLGNPQTFGLYVQVSGDFGAFLKNAGQAETVAAMGLAAQMMHGGLSPAQRNRWQCRWMCLKTKLAELAGVAGQDPVFFYLGSLRAFE